MRTLLHSLGAAIVAWSALAGAAAAQVPITYARSAPPAEERLAGGADNSYGYGAGADRERHGAVIDLRRSAAPQHAQAQPVRAEAPASQGPAPNNNSGAQPWLEQERVGPPYEVNGRWYVPTPEPGYEQIGEGSWYGPNFHGQPTASGETYDQDAMTAAHPTLPLNSLVQVTNLGNGREVIVRINDRGPFVANRLIDLSRAAAGVLGFEQNGTARVHVRYLGPAPRRVNTDGGPAPARAPARNVNTPRPEAAPDGPVSLLPEPVDEPQPVAQHIAYAPASGAFVVQVGAFSDLANAQRVRDAVAGAGNAQIDVRRTNTGAELFRVRVGAWETREEAESARRAVANLGFSEAVVAAR